jgi:hypothetical protein
MSFVRNFLVQLQQQYPMQHLPADDPGYFDYLKRVANSYGSNDDDFRDKLASAEQDMRDDLGLVPTPYEDPATYSILRRLVESIEQACMISGITLHNRPVFGTLQSGQINALTVKVPGDGSHIVLLERQMMRFVWFLCKSLTVAIDPNVLSQSSSSVDFVGDLPERLQQDSSAVDEFVNVLLTYVITGCPAGSDTLPPPSKEPWLIMLLTAVEMFIIGHEYGHVEAGHLNDVSYCRRILGACEVDEAAYLWSQEFEADLVGSAISIHTLHKVHRMPLGLAFCGSDIFFNALDRMDCAISILATGKEGIIRAASHPPALSRRDKLRSNISRVMYGKDGAFPLDVAVNLELLFNELWTRAKPKLEQAHALGYRPASCWRLSPTSDAT